MAMWEIDEVILNSIEIIENSTLKLDTKRSMIWNLEMFPEKYEFDAGGFTRKETDSNFSYKECSPFELANRISLEATLQNKNDIIYNWSALLLNFWSEYFSSKFDLNELKKTDFLELKSQYLENNFDTYQPISKTLTIYKKGNDWFDTEQNDLIRWFCEV